MNTSKIFDLLVVEDNPADVYLLRHALQKAGVNFELTVIEDGAEALEFVRDYKKSGENQQPDLAILDLNLPSQGGIEILTAIRKNHDLADVPVVILTSSSAPHERTQVEKLHISRFITKPADLADFLQIGNVLKELLGSETGPLTV